MPLLTEGRRAPRVQAHTRSMAAAGLVVAACLALCAGPALARPSIEVESGLADRVADGGWVRVVVMLRHESIDSAGPGALLGDPELIERARKRVRNSIQAGDMQITRVLRNVPAFAAVVNERALARLERNPNVAMVYQDRRAYAAIDESVPYIGAHYAWSHDPPYTGEGVTVAVLDTGIDYTHPALGGSTDEMDFPNAKVVGGWDFVNGDGYPMDDATSASTTGASTESVLST